jgi:hypothetical protein
VPRAPVNGSCHKQQMINNDKLNHGKPQLQLWIDSLNEMFLSRWTAHEQWNITFILLKTRRAEGHQFVNLLPDRHAKFVIIQWITCVVPKLANLLMHSQCALSEPISSSRKTRKLTVCRFIETSIYFWRIGIYPRLHLDSHDEKILKI